MDETLIHFDHIKRQYKARPYAHRFLASLSPYYELVVFTAGLKEYADYILDKFDTDRLITRRFYRDSCTFKKGIYMKDITKVNKNLEKVVIIDNISENF